MEPKMTQAFGIGNVTNQAQVGTCAQGPAPVASPEEDARSLLFQRAYDLEQEAAGLRLIASMVPTAGVLRWDAREHLLAAAKSIAGKGK